MRIELNKNAKDVFTVFSNYTTPITGLSTSFTGYIVTPAGVLTTGITITEIGSGMYSTSFIPTTTGTWSIEIREPTYFPWGKGSSYECDDSYAVMKRNLALTHENFILTGTAYDINGNLTQATMYTYEDSGFTVALGTYNVVAEHNDNSNTLKYQVKRV